MKSTLALIDEGPRDYYLAHGCSIDYLGRMSEIVYQFFGTVLPERALIDMGEIQFAIIASADVPTGKLFVAILRSQIVARYHSKSEVGNIFTLRNIVGSAVRTMLDAHGYTLGYAYDIDIVQAVRSSDRQTWVFGIDVPALNGVVNGAGISTLDILALLASGEGEPLRHALADAREAMKSPKDTGFFCYRAIESLKNGAAKRLSVDPQKPASWEAFRSASGISKDDIMFVKGFADGVRHGNAMDAHPVSDDERAKIFVTTWTVINLYIGSEKARLASDATARKPLKQTRPRARPRTPSARRSTRKAPRPSDQD